MHRIDQVGMALRKDRIMKKHRQMRLIQRRLGQAGTAVMAAITLLGGCQARSLAQFLNGSANFLGSDGTVYMIESTVPGTGLTVYVLDDPNYGGSGTQVNLWQINDGINQFWWMNNSKGQSDYYTIASFVNPALCLDCSNSGTAPGTIVQLWSCNGTWAQNWAIQTFGINQPYVIVPGNAYWMALTTPGAYNGALLTLQNQKGNTNDNWNIIGTDETDLNDTACPFDQYVNTSTGDDPVGPSFPGISPPYSMGCYMTIIGSTVPTSIGLTPKTPYFTSNIADLGSAGLAAGKAISQQVSQFQPGGTKYTSNIASPVGFAMPYGGAPYTPTASNYGDTFGAEWVVDLMTSEIFADTFPPLETAALLAGEDFAEQQGQITSYYGDDLTVTAVAASWTMPDGQSGVIEAPPGPLQ